tara:strand:+ start:3879 stop:4751 length:873 start_codon:yes stop_codon:yes gene_type:complete
MSKEEREKKVMAFAPIDHNKNAHTPERFYPKVNENSMTIPIPIPQENSKRRTPIPTFPTLDGAVIPFRNSADYKRNAKQEQKYINYDLREEQFKHDETEKLKSESDLPSVFNFSKPISKKKSEIKNIIQTLEENRKTPSALTILLQEEKKKGNKGGKTRKSTKSKKRRTKKKIPQFLYNPNDPKKSFDVYIDKNPDDTITIKYTTVDDVKNTIQKLEKLYKNNKYSHKRIWQVGMIMKVRLEAMLKNKHLYPNAKNVKQRYNLSKKYFIFLGKRSQEKDEIKRKKMIFNV